MDRTGHVRSFVYDTPEYHEAFRVFLEHTDQKTNALAWLERELEGLERRDVLIDAGAGNGKLTAAIQARFGAVVAIEPNPSLARELRLACPSARVVEERIIDSSPDTRADFVLCSHVFYYVPRADWGANLRRLASWLSPGGRLAIAIQNPDTDCMRMLNHFSDRRLDLRELCDDASSLPGGPFTAGLETVEANVVTRDLATATAVAEFMLNVLPVTSPLPLAELERYVDEHFRDPDGGFRFSCHQDFLRVEHVGQGTGPTAR